MIVVGGESLIDLVALPGGKGDVIDMQAHAGGSPYNCSIALAKLGNDVGFLCPISTDHFGDYLLAPLDDAGVEILIKERVKDPTSLAIVNLDEDGNANYQFYRSADRAFTKNGLIDALPAAPKLFQVGGFCAIKDDDASAWLDVADEALARGSLISIDPNLRLNLVDDIDAYKTRLSRFFDRAHIIKMSDEDMAAFDGSKSVEAQIDELLARPNCSLVILSEGKKGARAFTKTDHGKAEIYSPPNFGDSVGAGDSLMAGIISALAGMDALEPERLCVLNNLQLREMLNYAAVVAGLNCAHIGCHPPDRDEVELVLAKLKGQT